VRSAVFLSTDKAVQPINAMGLSKALMEKVAQAHARNNPNAETNVSCVRYGNVMYSRGSVIPLFIEQILAGQPITVTEPKMTRFLMSLSESVDLVEHAFTHASPGDVFIRKAAASTIADLGEALCNLFGAPFKMNALGIRHGEKMHETLASREELERAADFGDFFRVPVDSRDLNYSMYFEEGEVDRDQIFDFNSSNAPRLTVPEIEDLLLTLPQVRTQIAERVAA
jgi:UDP-glucose 4-epimerase